MTSNITKLHSLVFHAIDEQIAIIDKQGTIVEVNNAWVRFGLENGMKTTYDWVGVNYLSVLSGSAKAGDESAKEAYIGIEKLINLQLKEFEIEYPCHSLTQERWFIMRARPLQNKQAQYYLVAHYNITKRRQLEMEAEHLARHDHLTGLANRRYYEEFLAKEFRRCMRQMQEISLLMIDVDNFKAYNDEFGHLSGDACLVSIGRILLNHCRRAGDLAARLGGDEFCLVMGNQNQQESLTIAHAINEEVNKLNLTISDNKRITVSIGLYSTHPHLNRKIETLQKFADDALYKAKNQGKNRVESKETST